MMTSLTLYFPLALVPLRGNREGLIYSLNKTKFFAQSKISQPPHKPLSLKGEAIKAR
jgi:hypothetical protein